MIKHDKCAEFESEIEKREARIQSLKLWLLCLSVFFGASMMLMGAALVAYFESIL